MKKLILLLIPVLLLCGCSDANEEQIQWCYDNNGKPIVSYFGNYEKCILGSDK